MLDIPPESFALYPEMPVLGLPELTRNLHLLGGDYQVSGMQTAPREVLRGSMETLELRPGLVLYRTELQDLCTLRTSNLLYPGLKLCMLVQGSSELSYGRRSFVLGPGAGRTAAALVALAEPDRFTRHWQSGRAERKVSLTLMPEWLEANGVANGAVRAFCRQHLAVAPWRPSARAMALADQIGRPPEMAPGLRRLWLESRCLDIVVEALDVIARQPGATAGELKALEAQDALDARSHRRLRELRDFLDSGGADAMPLAAIARLAGMSASHLQRHFPKVGGTSVVDYLRQRQLLRARQALERGEADVAGAAALAGYASATNFATAFRRCFGITPRQARQRL
ncbi:DNA-binding domain-containing protein, AraC-type [Acidovorax sp. CF316]|uniref:helix-turn-helix transcriptional regulator n=1 Tax=Acidovorax sp. CF316 TaxID=1144317 RepID=UPI00026BD394|nr:AraC family transcriptional regulator [Acidovorax sp. CF316]EJE52620.1 DNA-binding domain-containing protein, AraC-type [Acidovorax sp. CF316]